MEKYTTLKVGKLNLEKAKATAALMMELLKT